MQYEGIRERRRELGLSQVRVAQAVNRSPAWVQKVEAGVLVPLRNDASRIAELLGREAEQLFSRIREEAA